MNMILQRLDQIADNPRDGALDVTFSERAVRQREDFCRALRVLIESLHAYHPHEEMARKAPIPADLMAREFPV